MLHRKPGLTVDDSFERWSTGSNASSSSSSRRSSGSGGSRSGSTRRLTMRGNSRKLVRTSSVSSEYAKAAGTLTPSSSSKGKLMLQSVVGFLSRSKSGRAGKPGSFTMTEPASPASLSSLSRTNSQTSAQDASHEDESGRPGEGQGGAATRPRVSFEPEVQTVFIEQMKEEEVRNTFYCRTEYAAFKEAYRTHRDTSSDWCRGNDVLPCSCDACQDDLVEGGEHIYSSSPAPVPPAAAAEADAAADPEDDDCDSAFEAPPPPPSPYAYGHKGKGQDDGAEEGERERQNSNEPPSPVGAVFQDTPEDTSSNSSGSSRGGSRVTMSRKQSSTAAASAAAAAPAASSYYVARKRRPAAHRRRGTWGVGSVPIASAPMGKSHNRGGSLDDWRVSASVQEAVKCHGEGYAYKTLRLQGFSDLYIRTHFLPEG